MSKFANLTADFTPTANWWELNPQMIYIAPYNKLYELDHTSDKSYSSKQMWACYFMRDPDETENKFFRFGDEKIKEMLSETYFKEADWWDNEEFLACLETWPQDCLNAVQRSLLDSKQSLLRRGKFLKSQEYTMETVKDLDMAHSKTAKIYEDYERVEEKFLAQKSSARVKGGRKQSKAETFEI